MPCGYDCAFGVRSEVSLLYDVTMSLSRERSRFIAARAPLKWAAALYADKGQGAKRRRGSEDGAESSAAELKGDVKGRKPCGRMIYCTATFLCDSVPWEVEPLVRASYR
ncbi:hypothetical protein AAFF_G00048950 [Aldrovandia affinis]|uniref:Uncharacterized protein n=1 Tax=Aldrovandia affinis TaxID=143900 RepID=A0AAD7S188_9TELE|nr:hypothetical protein AAFF_G00048950 [Aldrovandia affinis]